MAAAVLDSLDPATVTVGTGDVVITVHGSGLTADGALMWNNNPDTYTFIDDATITFDLSPITTDVVGSNTVGFRNALAETSNILVFAVEEAEVIEPPEPEIPPGQGGVQPKPEDSLSPNTPAQPAVYLAPEPHDVYQDAPVQVTEPTGDGVPRPRPPDQAQLPTTNAYEEGGLPTNPREPYPSGHPRADTWAQINGAR